MISPRPKGTPTTLTALAHARNNPTEATAWEQKRDALLAELRRRAGPTVVPE